MKKIRKNLLSAPTVARRLGIARETLAARLEKAGLEPDFFVEAGLRGPTALFAPRRLPKLARALGVSLPPEPIA